MDPKSDTITNVAVVDELLGSSKTSDCNDNAVYVDSPHQGTEKVKGDHDESAESGSLPVGDATPHSGSNTPKKDIESDSGVSSGKSLSGSPMNETSALNGTSWTPPVMSVLPPVAVDGIFDPQLLQMQQKLPLQPSPLSPSTAPSTGIFMSSTKANGSGGDGQSPSRHNRYSPGPHSRGDSPCDGHKSTVPMVNPNPPPTIPPLQHVVLLHVNPGEAISLQMGDQMQVIQGPATVRMVSNNATPPVPMPVQVPPGHMVQQIVDENGTLRHVILSPQPPLTVSMGPSYGPGPAPNTGPASSHFYPYPPPPPPYTAAHPHAQYHHHHPHPGGPPVPPPPPHLQPGVPHQLHGQMSPLSHQCNNLHPQGPSPPPLVHHQDERAQKRIYRLRRKLEMRQSRENSGYSSTLTPMPKKDGSFKKCKDRPSEISNLDDAPDDHVQDDEDARILTELLSQLLPPTVIDVMPRSALLRWKPPELNIENGESRYSEFDIKESEFCFDVLFGEKLRDGKNRTISCGNSMEFLLTDLKPATEYFISLQAVLDDLKGTPTKAISFKTNGCEPDPPAPPKVTARSKTSLCLKWNAASDNGYKISNYILEFDEGKGNGQFVEILKGPQKQFRVTKLTAATWYEFRLSAVNEVGRSQPSEIAKLSTTGSAPQAPSAPILVKASVHHLQLTWDKRPGDDGFSLQMESSSRHELLIVYNGGDTKHTCTNLTRSTNYKFKLRAENEEGNSQWSEVVSFCTLPDKPGPPGKPCLKGRVRATGFTLAWDKPRDDGGSEVKNFVVEMDMGEGFNKVYDGGETEFHCDHLTPGTTYHFRVMCQSAGGDSKYSEMASITTAAVCPGQCAPPVLFGKPKATTLCLKWCLPQYDGGSPILEYHMDMTSPDNTTRQVYQGKDPECTVAGLLPGRPYVFQVRCSNKVGNGPWSDPLEVVSGAGVPDRPKEPRITCKSPSHAIIMWEDTINNGATITEYRLEWSTKTADFLLLYQGDVTTYEVKGLLPATQYNFRVLAVNSAGSGAFSNVSSCITPPSSPGAIPVSSITHESTATCIRLKWQEPATNGSDIIAYNIDMGEHHSPISIGNSTSWSIENLQPKTVYRIRIQAVNSIGVGTFSSSIKVTTLSLPPSSPCLECISISHNSLKMKWGDGKNLDLIQYTLEMENKVGSFVPVYQGPSLTNKVSKLLEANEYRFRIYATNNAGDGPYSEILAVKTSKALPPPLKPPKVSEVGEVSCLVEWQPAKKMGDDNIIYQLQFLQARDQEFRVVYKGCETSHRIDGLVPKTEYSVRVGAIRHCAIGESDLVGAYSPSTSFVTQGKEPVRTASTKPFAGMTAERKPLSDQQWAMIIVVAFVLAAVGVTAVLQSFLPISDDPSST